MSIRTSSSHPLVALGDVLESISMGPFGSNLKVETFRESGVPVLRGGNLAGHRVDDSDTVFVTPEKAAELSRSLARPGDIVITHRGTLGQVSLIPRDAKYPEYLVSQSQLRITPDANQAASEYITYWLHSRVGQQQLLSYASQTGVPAISQPTTSIKCLQIPLPPLETQRAIAEVLGALDDKIAANRQFMETASELQQAMWARSTRDVTRVALAEIADIHLGGTPPRGDASAWDGNVAWASVRDMSAAPGGVILETSEHISRASADRVRRLTDLPPGSTFISARGTVGLVTTNAIPCAINQSAYALLARDVSPVGLRLAVAELGDYLRARAHGSVFDTITTETLNESLIPDLRDPSVRAIEPSIENLEAIRIAHARENQVLASTRDELLPLLMSGRITVRAASSHVEEVV